MSRGLVIARLTVLFVIAFSLGAVVTFARAVFRVNATLTEATTFTIEPGEGPREIGTNLKNRQLISHERPFYLYVVLTGQRHRFYPGTHELPPRANLIQIVQILTDSKTKQTAVTVIEGWRINDIAAAISAKTRITAEDFLVAAPVAEYEGYLFPDTYFFTPQTTATEAVKIMRQNFDRRTQTLALTKEDVILASIVEREARKDEDRGPIAAVYLNRLAIGMALEADPTVQYAKGDWLPITTNDYRSVESLYNTYLHRGLPPTPIANPGLKSLEAVKMPPTHDYYYFFTTPAGQTIYSKNLAEHNRNKAKYL